MAQIVSREQPRAAVTVAELLRRCAPALELDHDDAEPIPVSTLLRREGRRTGNLPRIPDQPQTKAADEPPVQAAANRGLLVRRSAIAAGALLAAGSVFGLTTAMHSAGEPPIVSGTYPGDGASADTPSTPLDSGTAAPTSWMPVAFPTALETSTLAKHALAASPPAQAASPAAVTSPAHAGTSGASTRQATSAPATSSTHGSGGGAVADTTKQLGDTVSSVGQNTPVAGVTSAVGTTVADAGSTVSDVGNTVGSTLDGTATPVVNGVVSATPVVSQATSTATGAATSTSTAVTKTVTRLLG